MEKIYIYRIATVTTILIFVIHLAQYRNCNYNLSLYRVHFSHLKTTYNKMSEMFTRIVLLCQ